MSRNTNVIREFYRGYRCKGVYDNTTHICHIRVVPYSHNHIIPNNQDPPNSLPNLDIIDNHIPKGKHVDPMINCQLEFAHVPCKKYSELERELYKIFAGCGVFPKSEDVRAGITDINSGTVLEPAAGNFKDIPDQQITLVSYHFDTSEWDMSQFKALEKAIQQIDAKGLGKKLGRGRAEE